jgi:hypothetical protein
MDSDSGRTTAKKIRFQILASLELRKEKRKRAKGKKTKEKA